MNSKLCFLFCLNLVLGHAAPFQMVDDYNAGLLLLNDGSVWECDLEDDEILVKGDIVDIATLDGELLGKIEGDHTVCHAFDFLVRSDIDGDVEILYGYISHLNNGEVLLGLNEEPSRIQEGQAVSLVRMDGIGHCLINASTKTFINDGIVLGNTSNVPIRRQVVEVTDTGYIFDDGFILNYSLHPKYDSINVLDKKFLFHFDPLEPRKLYFEINGESDSSKVSLDCRDQFLLQIDLIVGLEDGEPWRELVAFIGSKALKESFFPTQLKKGDRLAFYHIFNPLLGEDFKQYFYFVVRE